MKNFLLVGFLFFSIETLKAQNQDLPLIPHPQIFTLSPGNFIINSETILYLDQDDSLAREESLSLVDFIVRSTGFFLKPTMGIHPPSSNFIYLSRKITGLNGPEAYTLSITPEGIEIKAEGTAGLYYGITSLKQLFPGGGLYPIDKRNNPNSLPTLQIEDYPKYGWRGMHLDVSRHFFSIEFIKKYLDYLAWCKMNIFHWHLTDSQGWRLEIKKYPRLTTIGAYRVQRPGELFSEALPDGPEEIPNYGGYYTQDQVREVIKFAEKRHITIIPEIDMPGHCQAALVAYPQYTSIPGPQVMPSGAKGAYLNSFNPGKDSTYIFLQDILTEVMDLFPSQYIHIGGDEVDRSIWKTNPECLALIEREHLKSEEELQSYFTKRIEKFIDSKGRKMIGWDEILEGGIAPRATVMSWRGNKGGIKAVREGHEVIMAPDNFTYLDLYQGDPKQEPEAYSRLNLTTVYQFYPAPADLTIEERKNVLGGEGALWTETVPDASQVEYRLFPRLFALSESLWLIPQNKNWDSFKNRLPIYLRFLQDLRINYARSAYNVNDSPLKEEGLGKVKLACSNELNWGKIYYTTDGSYPSVQSTLYVNPFLIEGKKMIKMATFFEGKQISGVNEENFETSLSTSKEIYTSPKPSKRFPGLSGFVLSDGIRATDNPLDGRWIGFSGKLFTAELDLGKPLFLKNFGMDFFVNPFIGVYLPLNLEIEYSENGKTYLPLVRYSKQELEALRSQKRVKVYREFNPVSARFIRVRADIPQPGPYDNDHAYILMDEISVN